MHEDKTPLPPDARRPRSAGIVLLVAALAAMGIAASPSDPSQLPGAPRTWVRGAVREASYNTATLLDPRGLSGGPGEGFYVADLGHHRIAVVSGDGSLARAFGRAGDGPDGLSQPTDVAVDAARDRVYVADYGNRRIAVFTLAGAPIAHWRKAAPGQAFAPYAVAVEQTSGHVYAINRLTGGRVERFDEDGTWLSGWGAPGSDPGQFNNPEDLTTDAAGRILVADTNNGRVQVFGPDGAHLASWQGLAGARDVAVDRLTGYVYVLLGTDTVRVLLGTGSPLRQILAEDVAADFRPAGRLAIGAGGRMAITTGPGSADGTQGLRQYGADGAVLAETIADPLDHPGTVRPVAIDVAPDGSLVVLDEALRAAGRYAPDGALVQRLPEATGAELAIGPDGTVHVADRWGRLRTLAADGRVRFERTCDCFVGMGLAADGSQVYATEALTRAIGALPAASNSLEPHRRIGIANPPYAWPLDVALGPDGRLYAAGGDNGRIDVLRPDGGAATGWPAEGGGAERVSVAGDGTVFALRFDGSVAAYDPDGTLEAAWAVEPAPGRALVAPSDLAAGPNGRLYVLDGASGAIFVYEAAAAQPPTPTPESTPDSPCQVVGDKTAAPAVVQLGEEVTVRLELDIRCPAGSQARADVVLVLDRSNSMAGLKLSDAKRAAEVFVDGLDASRHQVALVSFSDTAALDQGFTPDAATVRGAIRDVEAHGTTDIAAALERASRHLVEAGRPEALGVILLLTDGEPTGSRQAYADTVRRAARARASGTLVYAVGLGANVDEALLESVAGGPDRYFFAPEADQLESIYRDLSRELGAVVAGDVQVSDTMGPDVALVPGSPSGRPVETGSRVTWALGAVTEGGLPALTLRVTPQRLGRLPTNTEAVALYTADGVRYRYVFPVPEIEVIDRPAPTATVTPTSRPSATATGTATRKAASLFLPIAHRPTSCPPDRRKPADILLVIDTSTSMTGDKLAQAVAAAKAFLGLVSPERDRVGLVAFDTSTRLVPLTQDLASVGRSLDTLTNSEGTRIDLALYEVLREFYYNGRPDAGHVAILLSDGRPLAGTEASALEQAELMREVYNVTLYVIGLGADADPALLRQLAAAPDAYYAAPTPEDLIEIYERIAVRLPCR